MRPEAPQTSPWHHLGLCNFCISNCMFLPGADLCCVCKPRHDDSSAGHEQATVSPGHVWHHRFLCAGKGSLGRDSSCCFYWHWLPDPRAQCPCPHRPRVRRASRVGVEAATREPNVPTRRTMERYLAAGNARHVRLDLPRAERIVEIVGLPAGLAAWPCTGAWGPFVWVIMSAPRPPGNTAG